jgi:hypothetical protein
MIRFHAIQSECRVSRWRSIWANSILPLGTISRKPQFISTLSWRLSAGASTARSDWRSIRRVAIPGLVYRLKNGPNLDKESKQIVGQSLHFTSLTSDQVSVPLPCTIHVCPSDSSCYDSSAGIARLYQGQGFDEIIAVLSEALKAGGRFKSFGLTVITHQC